MFGNDLDLFVGPGRKVERLALRDQSVVARPIYFVNKSDRSATDLSNLSSDDQFIFIEGGRFVSHVRLGDDYQRMVLFHFLVREAARAANVAAAGLEPDKVVRMVNDPHLVRLGITDPNLSVVPNFHKTGWETGIRTPIGRSRDCSPTIRRSPSVAINLRVENETCQTLQTGRRPRLLLLLASARASALLSLNVRG